MGNTNCSDIDWPNLFKPIPGLKQGLFNRVRINREVIPIVFVPGIMGSRLKNRGTGARVWDPDREIMCMLRKYGGAWNSPAQRKRMLIGESFHPDYLAVDEHDPDHNRKVNTKSDPRRSERGWGGVFWGSYGKFLDELQKHRWDQPIVNTGGAAAKEIVGKCFEFPVHAFGYNWTDTNLNSGKKLAEKIASIIAGYKSSGRLCKYVILVSHSMGGLVCRSACMLHGGEKNVLGVIHGVQPATGAPAAYWRMKAGFERTGVGVKRFFNTASAWVLGTNGEEVTCILGNAPGGLELLPNHHYTDNDGKHGWLHVTRKDETEVLLPQTNDPYEEIYMVKSQQYWRLINPGWLAPRDELSPPISSQSHEVDPWAQFIQCIQKAKKFHKSLNILCHRNTYQFFSSSLNTVDKIHFNREKAPFIELQMPADFGFPSVLKTTDPRIKSSSRGTSVMYIDLNDQEVKPPLPATTDLLSMSHPDHYKGGGDGTVPDSSGSALKSAINTHKVNGSEHQEAFNDVHAKSYVFIAIRSLALKHIHEEVTSAG